MTDPKVLVEIADHTIGVVPGQEMPFRVHIHGASPQRAELAVMISDPLGRSRYHLSDSLEITSSEHVHEMVWESVRRGQPGMYRLEAKLYLTESRQRIIVSRPFEMVVPGHVRPGVLRPVEREGTIRCPYDFHALDVAALRAAFDQAQAETLAQANGDGSYGQGYGSYGEGASDEAALALTRPLVRHSASVAVAHMLAYQLWGDEPYADLARASLDYLMARDQHESGAFVWWGTTEGVVNDQDSFYSTGYGALPLVMGHEILKHPGALEAARRAGDWTLDKPLTGNVNYDLFAMWFLPQLYRLTGEEVYLESAIWRTEGAAFDGQTPGGAWPGHNLSFGYHGIILLGLATLYRELPEDHPFRARLRERLIMAANFAASLIADSGLCYFGWEYNRLGFFVDWEGRPGGLKTIPSGPWCEAWRALDQCIEVDAQILSALCCGMCEAHRRHIEGGEGEYGRTAKDRTGYRRWADVPVPSTLWATASLLAWQAELAAAEVAPRER